MPDPMQDAINRSVLRAFETLGKIAEKDSEMQRLFSEGFRSLALQADRYDAELSEIRDGLADLHRETTRLFELHAHVMRVLVHHGLDLPGVTDDYPGYNVKVPPTFRCVPDESAGLAATTDEEE